MTIENMTEDFVGIAEKSKEKTSSRLTRREFLKIVGLGTGAFAVSNSWLGEYLGGFNPEFNKIEGTLSEYKIGWQAKPWVWTNLTIASKRIDGMKIMPGEQISLNSLLGFDEMRSVSRENTDPRKGYVTAQMSNPAELDGWGYGLCLGSTAIFRACLNSPLQITERGTHYDIYSDYFKDMAIGTDAAVFKPDLGDILPETDLKLRNPTDKPLSLHFGIYDSFGNRLDPPDGEVSLLWYKATYLDQLVRVIRRKLNTTAGVELPRQYMPENTFGNQKILVRSAVSGDGIDYKVDLSPVKHGDSTFNPTYGTQDYVFSRTLTLGGRENPQVITEKFVSNYGQSPLGKEILDRP